MSLGSRHTEPLITKATTTEIKDFEIVTVIYEIVTVIYEIFFYLAQKFKVC